MYARGGSHLGCGHDDNRRHRYRGPDLQQGLQVLRQRGELLDDIAARGRACGESEGIGEVDRIAAHIAVEIQPPREPDRVGLRELAGPGILTAVEADGGPLRGGGRGLTRR